MTTELRNTSIKQPRANNLSSAERNFSLGAGALLLAIGIGQTGKLRGLAAAGLGAAMLYRGATGYCHLYHLLGVESSEGRGELDQPSAISAAEDAAAYAGKNQVDKLRFDKLKATQVERGRDEAKAIDIAAEEVKELRRREGRSKEEQARYLEDFEEA